MYADFYIIIQKNAGTDLDLICYGQCQKSKQKCTTLQLFFKVCQISNVDGNNQVHQTCSTHTWMKYAVHKKNIWPLCAKSTLTCKVQQNQTLVHGCYKWCQSTVQWKRLTTRKSVGKIVQEYHHMVPGIFTTTPHESPFEDLTFKYQHLHLFLCLSELHCFLLFVF